MTEEHIFYLITVCERVLNGSYEDWGEVLGRLHCILPGQRSSGCKITSELRNI